MHPDLELLLQLQSVDYEIDELERSKEYMPDMMDTLREEMAKSETTHREAVEELTHLKAREKVAELELASLQEDLKRYQSQMMAIKTNKEYDALVSEIDTLKGRISEKENEILQSAERQEEIQNSLEGLQSNASLIKENNGIQLGSLQQRLDSVGDKVAERDHERQRIVTQVSRPSMSIYDRVRRGKGAQVVVYVKKRACGGCFKAVPPQRYQEIRRGSRVITCDNCGRLLVYTLQESE